jgi:hypothetical protein
MPGRTRRAERYDQLLERIPVLHLATNKKEAQVSLSNKDYLAFVDSVCLGLFKRIQSRNDQEGIALIGAFEYLETSFSNDVGRMGIRQASKKVFEVIARSSIPTLKKLTQPSSLQLAREASQLDATIHSRKDIKTRRCWVTDQGLPAETAAETDAALIEIILAKRHHISQSRVHKILAHVGQFTR